MALSAPWLVKHLIQGLQLYLSPNSKTLLKNQDPRLSFKYKHDNSNLFLIPTCEAPLDVTLLKLRASSTGRSFTASVTDNELTIETIFLKVAFESRTPESASTTLVIGSILRLGSFEFRLADHVNPPKVVLHLKNFVIVGRDDLYRQRISVPIHSHNLTSQVLLAWKDQQSKQRMDSCPSSPMGIRSQVGDENGPSDGSDVEKQNPLPTSQMQFATQVPLSNSPKKTFRRNVLAEEDVESTSNRKLYLKPNELVEHSAIDLIKSLPVQKEILCDGTDEPCPTDGEITQRQIIAPTSSIPSAVVPTGKQKQDLDTTLIEIENRTSTSAQKSAGSMPNAILQLFRALRKECGDGRHIPRYLQIIPKDQAKLLESDDQWQPPLVGRSGRPGTVPIDLLNQLTRKADHDATAEPSDALGISAKPLTVQENRYDPDEEKQVEASSLSPASTDSSKEVDWSPSPIRAPTARQALPPDSSPLGPVHVDKYVNDLSQRVHRESQNSKHTSVLSVAVQEEVDSNSSGVHVAADDQDNININDRQKSSTTNVPVLLTEKISSLSAHLTSPSLEKLTATDNTGYPRTVQVKRTPFPVKEQSLQHSPLDSSASIIPGTFDECVMKQLPDIDADGVNKFRTEGRNEDQHVRSFEHNSSEDELTAQNDNALSRIAKNTSSGAQIDLPGPSLVQSSTMSSKLRTSGGGSSLKRSSHTDHQNRAKRRKFDEERTISHNQFADSDYQAIDQDRVEFRRQYLGKIARKQDASKLSQPSIKPTKAAHSPGSSRASTEDRIILKSSPPLQWIERSNTSDTHRSIHEAGATGLNRRNLTKSAPDGINLPGKHPIDIFAEFQMAYPDYEGQRKHFVAACGLLRRLHLQGKATHPSLWDDFIFHHYHGYRTHLQEVMEMCGSALPYEKFYEECIEQPTHLLRVVKVSHINVSNDDLELVARLPSSSALSINKPNSHLGLSPGPFTHFHSPLTAESLFCKGVTPGRPNIVSEEAAKSSGRASQVSMKPGRVDVKLSEQLNDSQSSRTSVKIWLEKAAGAESPILGTPAADDDHNDDAPVIELPTGSAHILPLPKTPLEQTKRRKLPWTKNSGKGPSKAVSSQMNSEPVVQPAISCHSEDQLDKPTIKRSEITPTLPQSSTSIQRAPAKQSKKNDASLDQTAETAFQRFAKFYSDLPSEKRALKDKPAGTRQLIDFFSWRT